MQHSPTGDKSRFRDGLASHATPSHELTPCSAKASPGRESMFARLFAFSSSLHDEGQDDQARHSTRDLLPACNVVGAVPMPVRTTCFAIAGALSRAVYMPSALQAKTMTKQCEKHTDAPLRIGMPLGTSIGKDCVSRSFPYAVQKRHEALLDSTTQLSALRNSECPARTVEHSPGGPHQSSATQLSYQ